MSQNAAYLYEDDPLTDDCIWYLAGARNKPVGPRLVALCQEVERQQATLLENTRKCQAVFQFGGEAIGADPEDHFAIEENLLSYNASKNTVETVFAKVIKPTITIMPLTNGGGYLARHRAKQMEKAIEGVLADNEITQIEEDVLMDCLTTDHGSGAIAVIEKDDCIKLKHIPIEDVWFDEAESRTRDPRCCYYVPADGMDKYVAIEEYARPDDDYPGLIGTWQQRRQAILRSASRGGWKQSGRTSTSATSRVRIYEAWHLPSGKVEEYEADEEYEDEDGETQTRKVKKTRHDGRHTVTVDAGDGMDGTLIDEPWCEDHFPILIQTPRPRRRGIWGMSLMRDLISPQREYEKVSKKIQHQHQKMGLAGLAVSKDANINVREITSGTFSAGFVVEYENNTPPVPFVVEPVAAGTYGYLESIPRNMNERHGISTMAASSQLPAGLSQASGKALQVFEDFEDVRLLPYHRARERFKVKLAWIIVCTARRIVDRKGKYEARYHGKKGIERVDWKEVLLDAKDFVLKVFPVSALSKQPAAKFAQLTELLNAGAITVEQFKRLFELPDLEAENEIDTADTDIIDRTLDIIVTTGRYISPEPFDALDLMLQRAGKFYNLCRQQEVPEARLQLLRDLMEDVKNLQQQALPPPMPDAPPGMPMDPNMLPPGPAGMVPPAGPLPGMPPGPPLPMAA